MLSIHQNDQALALQERLKVNAYVHIHIIIHDEFHIYDGNLCALCLSVDASLWNVGLRQCALRCTLLGELL